jgi:chromosome segregation ATPase
MSDDRDDAVQLAGALQTMMADLHDENTLLKGQCDSYRAGFEAVSSENESLRTSREKIVRRLDAAQRELHLLKSKMRQINAMSGEAMHAVEPQRGSQQMPDVDPGRLKVVQRGPA